ncbi:hypothetical protein TL16_g00602 [Triparma laevis f. inornata]|nr:hypothetical protein TL16_g00602 [Triparma laevis f. inornata]
MLNHILCIDWLKNMQWAGTCMLLASCTDKTTQKGAAIAFMGMMAGALGVIFFIPPSGTVEIPPPVIMYMGVTFPLYIMAIMGGDKDKKK